jgi:gas vesicle protein
MAKQRKLNKWEEAHRRNMEAYGRQIDEVFRSAAREAAMLASAAGDFSPDRPFSFEDYPATRRRVEKLLSGLENSLTAVIVNGVEAEWTLANNKNSELANQVFGDNASQLTEEQSRRYYTNNDSAREAFIARKTDGLKLSDRVWRYTQQFKTEIELGIDIGLREGRSADELSRDLRQYLKYPDKLFRRVRDEHGNLVLSQAAKAFHPGQGVYRSSYKNAWRLAVTETNIAYRTADFLRWQQMDFVVGIRVVLSNNHTLNGQPFEDICDQLSAPLGSKATNGRGCYPKDFKFTGWHPLCRCHVETILKTEEEMAEDNRRIMAGEDVSGESANTVKDVPRQFKKWIEENRERAQRSYSVPYFLSDNKKYLPENYLKLWGMKTPYATYAEYAQAMKYNKAHAVFTDAQQRNNRELSDALPVIQGKIMNFTEADGSRCNPKFTIENAEILGYRHNCQTCTVAYELRRRGFNIEAAPNPVLKGYKKYRDFDRFCNGEDIQWTDRFLTEDGKRATYKWSTGINDTGLSKLKFIEDKTAAQGRYEIYCAWKKGDAHVFIVERQKDGNLLWFDPQSGRRGSAIDFNDDINAMRHNIIGILRIDDKLINPVFSSRFKKSVD